MLLSRLARSCVLVSAGLAIAAQVWLASALWPRLPLYTAAAFVAAVVLARFAPLAATVLALLPACILPALASRGTGYYDPAHVALWLAPMLGVIAGRDGLRDWRLPGAWAPALGHYVLCLALSWVVIAFREVDWQWALVRAHQPPITAQGVPAPVAIIWITYVVSAQLIAVLWFDAMFATAQSAEFEPRERPALLALIASAGAGVLVAIVQMTSDMSWLNSGMFAYLGRASGLMLDANAFGMSAGLASALALALAIRHPRRPVIMSVTAFVFAAWIGIWGSGSRTAFVVGAAGTAAAIVAVIQMARSRRTRMTVLAVIVVASVAMASTIALSRRQTVGPLARLQGWLQDPEVSRSVSGTIAELWNRDGYGKAAVAIIRDHPIVGVGPGAFYFLVLDYTFRMRYPVILPADNAQNWFRHQVAEVGVLGSVGWLVWLALFVFGLVRARARIRGATLVLVAALGALGLISLVGMPTQNPAVLILAATVAAWTWRLAHPDDVPGSSARWPWMLTWGAAIVFVALTARTAWTDLRVPARAAVTGWEYSYGWYDLDGSSSPPFRWTKERAVAVVKARGRFLRLRMRTAHPDLAEHPVEVRVTLFDRTIVAVRIQSEDELVRYVLVPKDGYLPLTFTVSRTFQAPGVDPRELGLAVDDWTFVDSPPPNAWIVR